MRRGELLKEAQFICRPPTSVGGGENADGNWSLIAGFCGPGSMMLLGFLALIAPCGGSFGLPKEISCFTGVAPAVVAAVTTPPTAVAANISRLDIMFSPPLGWTGGARCIKFRVKFIAHPSLRPDQNRDRFGRRRFAFNIVVGQRKQWIGFRVVGANRTLRDGVGPRLEALHHALLSVVSERFDLDQSAGLDSPLLH